MHSSWKTKRSWNKSISSHADEACILRERRRPSPKGLTSNSQIGCEVFGAYGLLCSMKALQPLGKKHTVAPRAVSKALDILYAVCSTFPLLPGTGTFRPHAVAATSDSYSLRSQQTSPKNGCCHRDLGSRWLWHIKVGSMASFGREYNGRAYP